MLKYYVKKNYPFLVPVYHEYSHPFRRIKNLFNKPQGIVLMYHRIVDDSFDTYTTVVSVYNFRKQIKYLRDHFEVRKLNEWNYPSKDKWVVITLDDGYVDNYKYAAPILNEYSCPATFFISTKFIGKDKELWDNDFIRMIKYRTQGSEISFGNGTYKLKEDICRDIYNIRKYLYNLSGDERNEILKFWECQLQPSLQCRNNYRIMNEREICEIDKSFLFEIGNHAEAHERLSIEKDSKEIVKKSHEKLVKILNHEITSFSYPFGETNPLVDELLKEFNYKNVVMTKTGQINKNTNSYKIPRWNVQDWTVEEFAKRIDAFFIA